LIAIDKTLLSERVRRLNQDLLNQISDGLKMVLALS
jgi:hypothetical protein